MNINDELIDATAHEDLDRIEILLNSGANVNHQGYAGNTPLHAAVDISIDGTIQQGGKPGDEPLEIIEILLKNGADMSIKNERGETPLGWARNYESEKVVKYLERFNS